MPVGTWFFVSNCRVVKAVSHCRPLSHLKNSTLRTMDESTKVRQEVFVFHILDAFPDPAISHLNTHDNARPDLEHQSQFNYMRVS